MCLRYMRSISSPFRSGRFRSSTEPHFISPSLQAYTSAPHCLGKYSFPFRKLIHSVFPKPFSNANPAVYIYFCDEFTPIRLSPFG